MTSKFTLSLVLTLICTGLYATTWTVSNRADKPAQFTQVQPAIDGAQPGDTIIIAGSPTAYSAFTVNRRLILFGEGVNNPDGNSTVITGGPSVLANVNSGIGASGSQFFGIVFSQGVRLDGNFTGQLAGENKIENVVFERCQLDGYPYWSGLDFSSQIYNNVTIRNCLFIGALAFGSSNVNNILVTNCIFTRSDVSVYSGSGSHDLNGQLFIRNSNFMNRSANDVFNVTGIVVENCIFYGAQPTGANTSTFNNNLTYANSNNALPNGSNVGSGNLIGVDPKFTTFPVIGGAFTWSQDFTLLAGSPALGTGTNGTDMGITGGNSPAPGKLFGNSKLPVVTEINIPVSSVPVGGTLQVNIKAKTRN